MKLFIVLAVFVCCAYAAPLKNELLQRANALEQKVKTEIKRLEDEKRGHLAVLLQEEGKRLETLATELKNVADSEEVRKVVLEDQLITMEYRVENELNILQRDAATQELLEDNAKVLMEWVNEEIKLLENTEGSHRARAHAVARVLRREVEKLAAIAEALPRAQDQRKIAILEVTLRALEVRLYEALRGLHFEPSTGTSARPTTAESTSARPATAEPTSRRPATMEPTSGRPSTRAQ